MPSTFESASSTGPLLPDGARQLIAEATERGQRLAGTPIESIIDTLDAVGRLWIPGSTFYNRAVHEVAEEVPFSGPMIESTLDIVHRLYARPSIVARLRAAFGEPGILDTFIQRDHFAGRVMAVPLGVVLHVAAGNVFIGCVDSLLLGFLTKNVSILKLSSRNLVFPRLFAESIREADPRGALASSFAMVHWHGGDAEVEAVFKKGVDAIIAFGGAEMLESYRQGLGPSVRLIEHGPKLSFQVITAKALAEHSLNEVAQGIARDVCTWDQAACASPQNLFVQKGTPIDPLLDAIGAAMDGYSAPRGTLDAEEQVEILKERFRGKLTSLTEGGHMRQGKDWLLHFDPSPGLRPSALNRTLVVKGFEDVADLCAQVRPYAGVLQSCGYLATGSERDPLLRALAGVGVQRFNTIGHVLDALDGAPHDGRFSLAELTRWVGDETVASVIDLVNDAIDHVPFYRRLYAGKHVAATSEFIPIDGSILASESLVHSSALLRHERREGYIFSSGGTSGQPKYCFYQTAEFNRGAGMLAKGLARQGIEPGDVCANLFVAGNLWSSFMAIERALALCGAVQLPIGGMVDPKAIMAWLREFRPKVALGVPSRLIDLAGETRKAGIELDIPVVCYAGEHLNGQARNLLAAAWKTQRFFSAGYATVDAGAIGYQCRHCEDREHHLLSEYVHMEIVDGEAVVTSKLRRMMPILHLRTGDHVEWKRTAGVCACGSSEPTFVLHGRVDGQINIWASRIQLGDIDAGLHASGVSSPVYQVVIEEGTRDDTQAEWMTIRIEGEPLAAGEIDRVKRGIYEKCKSLMSVHPFSHVEEHLRFVFEPEGAIERITRTGKVRTVVDKRRI
jgi:phenylacetate-coenzyme A ligase PaaK-like adenylate-forming protein